MSAALAQTSPQRSGMEPPSKWIGWVVRVLLVALLVAGVLYARRHLLDDNAHPRARAQRITLVTPQRPVPPKPVEDKPKEPETRKQEVALVEQAIAMPPGEKPRDDRLGVDANAEGAGDGFGLVAKRGGRDITTLGGGGTGAGAGSSAAAIAPAAQRFSFGSYGGLVTQRLQGELRAIPSLLKRDYVAIVAIWIDARGRIVRSELPQSSGFTDIDSSLRKALAEAPVMPEPPSGLPLPLKLRITAKDINDKGG